MSSSIAIVGMACVYPDARTPAELWENVLAQRRAFRRLPPERIRGEDYWSADREAPDRTYALTGAVIEGYDFDRVAFRVAGSTYRSADLAHWLALDVASRALADAGYCAGGSWPRASAGVLVGNTLTGEFTRANGLRLRWPYVRRVVEAALARREEPEEVRRSFLDRLEADYKSAFPPVGEETLAGGLSNTIAGRICNHFDFKGGGYTIDGACASSLLAIANACSALVAGDLDLALAGGVDLSLDPFELVGFAKTGALAAEEMRIFDQRSAGFWPGEGCGFVTLMRHEDALALGCRVYAVIRGWGISSDGSGGITRPEAGGQFEALRRAYRRAGFSIDTVGCCEGHGTGTAVGDATELEVLCRARREGNPGAPPAAIGSIKANIGHTKAAAGVAGLIKATMSVHSQVLPPTTGCEEPHPQLRGRSPALRVLREAELWPPDRPLRASVSAMGFGGINAHVVLEGLAAERRRSLAPRERSLSLSNQDAELFLFSAGTLAELAAQLAPVLTRAAGLSQSELADLATELQRRLKPGQVRAAVVASWPAELAERLHTLKARLQAPMPPRFRFSDNLFLGSCTVTARIGFLFPGQGSPARLNGGIWERRFECVRRLYGMAALPAEADCVSTAVMQPAVVTASLAGLKVLEEFGLSAVAAIGHSLGEITAFHWAGVMSDEALLRIARVRGAAMADLGSATGAMLAISAPSAVVQKLLDSDQVSIVGFNSPRQTVVAGEATAIQNLVNRARAAGLGATPLPVSHAFHTRLVAAAVPVLAERLASEHFAPIKRSVISTITGGPITDREDLRALLTRQVTSPVQFSTALAALVSSIDLLIEVGPGSVLSGLVNDSCEVPVVALDAGGPSLKGLLQAVGAAFVLGAPVRDTALFAGRFTRPFSLDRQPKFFVNPCELAPLPAQNESRPLSTELPQKQLAPSPAGCLVPTEPLPASALDLVRELVAKRAELPEKAILDDHRMLSDLHLNSITVGQVVSESAKRLGLPRILALTDFANASVVEIARAMEELKQASGAGRKEDLRRQPPGVDIWIERFTVELVEAKRPARANLAAATPPSPGVSSVGWQVFAPEGHPLARPLLEQLTRRGAGGVLVCLPENPNEDHIRFLLDAGRAAIALPTPARFVLVQHGWGGAGFARTLHLETPGLTTCVVNVPAGKAEAISWIVAEAESATGYVEAHFDDHGMRRAPRLKLVPFATPGREVLTEQRTGEGNGHFPIGPGDVLLVTGGGKGIAAECALALGRETGARLLLLGRSDPAMDRELAENLARISAADVTCRYLRADVTDAEAVRSALSQAEEVIGPVTALLHGAGANTPRLISALDEAAFRRSVAPKLGGLRNVLAAIDPARLRLFVTFGSIIARAGLRGEADYATANEWLTAFTEQFQAGHPKCRCLALEWSVWSGVGMGERLGRVDSLIQQGIMPIPPDEGVRLLLESVRHAPPAVASVVTGRFGEPPTLKISEPELPLWRFLERKRVYYPGVELIVDTTLSLEADPYLNDHVFQNQKLFPAVLGLEAMAQTAMALTGSTVPPSFEQVRLTRPVVVPDTGSSTIRLAALRRAPNVVEVCLRSEETDYHVDHFRALCRFGVPAADDFGLAQKPSMLEQEVELEPQTDLYGGILFHEGRFCRLTGYRSLSAKACVATIAGIENATWFGPYLPSEFVLGDPGARDAALHAIQACIPHRRILPTGIDRLVIAPATPGARLVRAVERSHEGDNFVYDLEITGPDGEVIERWEGLGLRAIESLAPPESWPQALLGPYLERRLEELVPSSNVRVALERSVLRTNASTPICSSRPGKTDTAIWRALGRAETIWRRADGKPVALAPESVSAAHALDFTLAVAGAVAGCDLEAVAARSDDTWRDLLGDDQFKLAEQVSQEGSETVDAAASRLWAALECLKKAGRSVEAPLVLESTNADGWVVFRSGSLSIATCVTAVRGLEHPLAAAIAVPSSQPADVRDPVGAIA